MEGRASRLVVAVVAAFLAQGCVAVPAGPGSPGPWSSGGIYGYPDYDRGYDYDDELAWERPHPTYPCDKVDARIAYDRAKITEIEAGGRHRKALQWYKDDLANAQRDKRICRAYRHERRKQAEWERWEREREKRARLEAQREECRRLEERIRYDRAKIAEIEPGGRHRKALQWYKDDIVNAQRDIANRCRGR